MTQAIRGKAKDVWLMILPDDPQPWGYFYYSRAKAERDAKRCKVLNARAVRYTPAPAKKGSK